MAQLMPLPLTVSCFSKIQIGFTSLVQAQPGSPGKRAAKRVCACVRAHITCGVNVIHGVDLPLVFSGYDYTFLTVLVADVFTLVKFLVSV